jgi:hypothetical protein
MQRTGLSLPRPLTSLLACAGILGIAIFVQYYNRSVRFDMEPRAQVEGTLKEWSALGLTSSKAGTSIFIARASSRFSH